MIQGESPPLAQINLFSIENHLKKVIFNREKEEI